MTDHNTLSGRETEILQLVAQGLTNREIAQHLTISPNTVKVHLRNIFEKIGVSSRTEATMYGIEHGILDVPGGAEAPPPEEPARWAVLLRKYAWFVIPLVLLVVVGLSFLVFSLLRPSPPPEDQALADLAERWRELAPMPAARAAMAAAAYDGQIYAIAGEGPEGVSGSVFRYSPDTDSWEQLSDKPTPVADVHSVLIGEKIYVPGGRLADGSPTDMLEIYDPRRDSWSEGARLPKPVSAYALADFEGQLYLFGGWDGTQTLDVVYVYDPGADAWREGTRMAIPRRDHGAVALADQIVVLGGRNAGGALKDAVGYFPARDVEGEDPWADFIDLPENCFQLKTVNIFETIYLITESNQYDCSPLQYKDQLWQPWVIDVIDEYNDPHLITISSNIYLIFQASEISTNHLWRYQAIYYEIYIPIIK